MPARCCPAACVAHDAARGLTRLGFAGGELTVPLRDEPPGTQARSGCAPATWRWRPSRRAGCRRRTCCRRCWWRSARRPPRTRSFLRLRLGESELLSRVTRDSVARLGLVPGMAVWAVVKAVTFDRAGGPLHEA